MAEQSMWPMHRQAPNLFYRSGRAPVLPMRD